MTPLLTASTPVMAVHPLENARSISHRPMASVAGPSFGGATTGTGCPPASSAFATPTAIKPSMQAMNT